MPREIRCFKAYDIRGRVPDELNEDVAYRIGRAFAEFLRPQSTVVGRDIRLSGPALAAALMAGLNDAGVHVLDIGLCGTEQVYFATFHLGAGGGIMVTASHNPADYNGMKLVREQSKPISGDSGLSDIRRLAEAAGAGRRASHLGAIHPTDVMDPYISHLLSYADLHRLRPLKLVVNAGNGAAGPVIDRLERELPHQFIKIQHEPDGAFPNGVPNPLLPSNRQVTADAVRAAGADMGIAWDGDFDRCFLFDEQGEFIEGYYIVGLLARAMLVRSPGARIVHDPRLVWNTREIVSRSGGIPVMTKTGHAFIKERMRLEDAAYGGEMSAHHYFRDFAYCDSGMIPWLLVTGILAESGRPLSELVREAMARYPVSGEINRAVADPHRVLGEVRRRYEAAALNIDETDGLSFEFSDWRFNLRLSNTEPVIRLNVEARANRQLMEQKTAEILQLVERA
jgi:phosphomannomutase/phosphomannomutase/phosphoglucomutase